jgi:hypothetical protein
VYSVNIVYSDYSEMSFNRRQYVENALKHLTSLPVQKVLSSLSEARPDPDTTKELAQDRNTRYK